MTQKTATRTGKEYVLNDQDSAVFHDLRKKYFPEIPADYLVVRYPIPEHCGYHVGQHRLIFISPELAGAEVRGIIFHEMAHYFVLGHGKDFQDILESAYDSIPDADESEQRMVMKEIIRAERQERKEKKSQRSAETNKKNKPKR